MDLVTTLSRSGPLTRTELDALPDDGRRHELIDGCLIVTPAPSVRHQQVLARLHLVLASGLPDGLRLLFAPLDVALGPHDVLQPDLLVAPDEAFTARDLSAAPLLAVEVLSPSTRRVDLGLKLRRYEAAGCASYWVVDPDEPRLLAWELRDHTYELVADLGPDDAWTATQPYAVTITPRDLVR